MQVQGLSLTGDEHNEKSLKDISLSSCFAGWIKFGILIAYGL